MSKIPIPLIAIKSCHKRWDYLQACLKTWVPYTKENTCDVLSFAGQGSNNSHDVQLDVPDDYLSLPFKTVAIIQWALEEGYTNIVMVDDDCYFQGWEMDHEDIEPDYWGGKSNHGDYCWGVCYGLSKKSMEIVAAQVPTPGAEDVMVGKWLEEAKVQPNYTKKVQLVPKVGGHNKLNFCALAPDTLGIGELEPRKMVELHNLVCQRKLTGKGELAIPASFYHLIYDRHR